MPAGDVHVRARWTAAKVMTAIGVESAATVAAGDSLSVFRAATVSRAKTVARDTVAPRTHLPLERRNRAVGEGQTFRLPLVRVGV